MNTYPSGTLRVSDADRDRAISELSEHFQAGRLTVEELEDRTGQALAARTARELADLFTDLPRQKPPVPSAAPAPVRTGSFPLARIPAVPIVVLAVIVLTSLLSGHHSGLIVVPVLAVLVIVRRLSSASRSGR